MGRAKEIIVKVIPAKIANEFIKKNHYSGKVVNNSNLHFGCFLDGKLHGVMSYGSPLDKRKVLPLAQPALWNEMLELNRMAFDENLPKNSESRCIAISLRLIKKNAPHIKWILSFSDGTQCGDGTIYRASGFQLTGIKENDQVIEFPDGRRETRMSLTDTTNSKAEKLSKMYGIKFSGGSTMRSFYDMGCKAVAGFQLRYIYLIDKNCKITVPIIPFSKIDELGAGMYKGKKITLLERKKQAELPHKGEDDLHQNQGAFDSTVPLKTVEKQLNG